VVGLRYPKNSLNPSDEEGVVHRSENTVWQYFSGLYHHEHRLACDAMQLGRFGKTRMTATWRASC
jgi:hypothetical protein